MPNFAAKWLLPFAVCDVQDSFGCFLKWWYPHFTPQVLIILSRKTEWVGWVPPTILGNHPTYMARVVPPSNLFHFMSTPRQGTARTNGHGLAPAIRPGAKGCCVGTWLSLWIGMVGRFIFRFFCIWKFMSFTKTARNKKNNSEKQQNETTSWRWWVWLAALPKDMHAETLIFLWTSLYSIIYLSSIYLFTMIQYNLPII